MKKSVAWAEALQITQEKIDSWTLQAPSPEAFTYWCLLNEKIDSKKYYQWAQKVYGLALLDAGFLETPPAMNIWNQMKSVANWSEHMFPVAEWDGVVFVGCVEPKDDIQWSFPVKYLLVEAKALQDHWNRVQASELAAPEVNTNTPNEDSGWTDSVSAAEAFVDVITEEDKPEEAIVAEPEGLELSPPPTEEAPQLDQPDGLSLVEAIEAPEGMDQPEGLEEPVTNVDSAPNGFAAVITEDDIPTDPSIHPEGFTKDSTSVPVLQLDKLTALTSEEDLLSQENEKPKVEESIQSNTLSEISSKSEVSGVLKLGALEGEAAEKLPPNPEGTTSSATSTSIHNASQVAVVLDDLKNDFEASILLSLEQGELKPLVWDQGWKPKEAPRGPENMKDASAFRVVCRSKHPYLGHLIDTPINRKFFEAWGMTEYPEKVLVQPVLHNDALMGVMVCVCNVEVKNQVLLNAGKKHADSVARMLYDSQVKAA